MVGLRDIARARHERATQRREHAKDEDPIARLRARADAMVARAADLKKLADAQEPLYRALTDDQKKRFRVLVRHGIGSHHHGGRWHHHM